MASVIFGTSVQKENSNDFCCLNRHSINSFKDLHDKAKMCVMLCMKAANNSK